MSDENYQRIEKAILYLCDHFQDQPSLKTIAATAGLSEFHFQRIFQRWAGVTPKQFLQYLTATYVKQRLNETADVLNIAYESGLSSPSRLHELMVKIYAATPSEVKNKGAQLIIRHAQHWTPFGKCFIAATQKGICQLTFIDESTQEHALDDLKSQWPNAVFHEDFTSTLPMIQQVFNLNQAQPETVPLNLFVQGSHFQIKVWEALLKIPPGKVVTYHDIAALIKYPNAHRAVANAIGKNPVAFLIPCHRIIRKNGIIGGYRWGTARKKAIFAWEASQSEK